MTAQERMKVGSNRGMYVLAVREGSPAFEGDLLPGDIILTVEGERLAIDRWNTIMKSPVGTIVRLGIRRGEADKSLAITIPTNWN